MPIPDPVVEKRRERIILTGDVPSPINPPSGCVFHTRCPYVMDVCSQLEPKFVDQGDGHYVACHLYPGCTPDVEAASFAASATEQEILSSSADGD